MLCWKQIKTTLAGYSFPGELVIWGKSGGVGRVRGRAVRGELLWKSNIQKKSLEVVDAYGSR